MLGVASGGLRRLRRVRRVLGGFGVRRFLGVRPGLAAWRLCPRLQGSRPGLRGSRWPGQCFPLIRAFLLWADPPSAEGPRAGEELLAERRARWIGESRRGAHG